MKYRLAKGLLAAAAALTMTAVAVAPAQAANLAPNRDRYAAVGDSFAYGVGTPKAASYPAVLAGKVNKVTLLAVSGADTEGVAAQVALIPPTAQQVTVTVGGNDGGAFTALGVCLRDYQTALSLAYPSLVDPSEIETCVFTAPTPGEAAAQTAGVTALLGMIQTRAPFATIYVTGYPLLFAANTHPALNVRVCTIAGVGTLPGALFDGADFATWALNGRISTAVDNAQILGVNAQFVPVDFGPDQGLCDGTDSWIQGPADLAPLHPTVDGLAAYADAIADAEFITGPTR